MVTLLGIVACVVAALVCVCDFHLPIKSVFLVLIAHSSRQPINTAKALTFSGVARLPLIRRTRVTFVVFFVVFLLTS